MLAIPRLKVLVAGVHSAAWWLLLCGHTAYALTGPESRPANLGLSGVTVGPDGRIAELVYVTKRDTITNALRYRERMPGGADGQWQTVTDGARGDAAFLWFDAENNPRVIYDATTRFGSGTNEVVNPQFNEVRRTNDTWSETGRMWKPSRDGRVVFAKNGEQVGVIRMDTNRIGYSVFLTNGTVTAEETIDQGFVSQTLLKGFDLDFTVGLMPRNLSAAFDVTGRLHVVYSTNQISIKNLDGTTMQRSSLFYSRRETNGTWLQPPQEFNSPGSGFGDGGIGASIACAPDGTVAIATAYLPRVASGSTAPYTELRYMLLQQDGTWSTSVVANRADDYISGDGQMGTGLEPLLTFDAQSRPFIVFTDHASAHIPFCFSWSGQVRMAARSSSTSGAWALSKLVSRAGKAPSDFVTGRPAVVVSGDRVFVSALSFAWVGDWAPQYDFLERTVPQALAGTPVALAKSGQTITFKPTAKQKFKKGRKFTLSATATSKLPVSFKSSNTKILSIKGRTATIHAKGKVTVTASQGGNANYLPAKAVKRTIAIK